MKVKYRLKDNNDVEAFRLCMEEAPLWFLTEYRVLAVPQNKEGIVCEVNKKKARKGDYVVKIGKYLTVLSEKTFKRFFEAKADDDPNKKWCVSLRMCINAVMGTLYDMAPYGVPRKADIISQKFQEAFKKNSKVYQDFYFYEMQDKEIYGFFEKLLKGIPEFVELNLSKVEYEKGISVDDPSRPPFACVSRDSWIKEEHEFIDLDAAVRNIVNAYFLQVDDERDMFARMG